METACDPVCFVAYRLTEEQITVLPGHDSQTLGACNEST